MRVLLFTLYAPMGSLGEIAVGERRMSWTRPSRSAVFGLVAAALGIERADEAGHRHLETGLYFAVRTDATGRPFMDYHTAQTPRARKGRSFATRRQEVMSGDAYTILSSREWLADPCFTVSLWPRPNGGVDLEEVGVALRRPRFALYLGRKSAPLGLPLNPVIVEAQTFMDAFSVRQRSDTEHDVLERIRGGDATELIVAFDQDAPGAPADARLERRRDAIVSRQRWQFADRLEGVATVRSRE
ncbi:MAG: type I-E CRISPR-associated protein Cas5/CasD [Spirochaetaceae bacterium]|nr:type I-E CRISPR-associated protein Cas5/CasD [Spirochaetaceae bacterium]